MECPIETVQNTAATDDLRKIIENKDEGTQLLAVMKKMKNEYQEVIHLRYIEGLSVGDIAEVLEKNYVNVRVLLHRAVKKLKEMTEEDNNKKT
jgi:RNA polymerase sigma-70 factor (ECF subfamily)